MSISPPRILFVCTGNICRSPTAEAVLLHRAQARGLTMVADSAGTSAEEEGNPPDRRSRAAARARGYALPARRARRVRRTDFAEFDRILAMTTAHLRTLERQAPQGDTARLQLFMDFVSIDGPRDVPDPWYGGDADFEYVLDLIETGIDGLIADLERAP